MAAVSLWIDIESRSATDLKARGLDVYSKDPSTQITLFGWCINDADPVMWHPLTEPIPEQLVLLLNRREIPKLCFNSQFEQTMLREVLKIDIPTEQFVDVAVMCRYASIAGNLEFCGKVLGIDEDQAKMKIGKTLIHKFCSPTKDGTFRDWASDPEDWALFKQYCANDIRAERAIYEKLKAFHLPPAERKVWVLDQEINRRGIPTDMDFVERASQIVKAEQDDLLSEFKQLTGLDNPGSVKQLLGWLKSVSYPYNSLGARWVTKALIGEIGAAGRRGLELRQLLAKSSTAKLAAITDLIGPGNRLRYQFVYGGAARTLRWSGRGVQPHNMPRPSIKDVEGATEAILTGDREKVRAFGPPLASVSSCLRGALKASLGKQFVVCDLSSIETVGSAWLTGCTPLLKVFAEGRDPYKEFATKLFGVPYEAVTKEQRQQAKPAVLGACYGLGGGEEGLDKNGDDIRTGLWGYSAGMGIEMEQEFAQECVRIYRASYPEIVQAWRLLEIAAGRAALEGKRYSVCNCHFDAVPGKILYLTLPSGRRLHYIRPKVEQYEWYGKQAYKVSYENNVLGGWGRVHTFGGKWLENCVQALSRDILAAGMLKAAEVGFSIVAHAHDEIVCEEEIGSPLNGEKLRECMVAPQAWAQDLPLDAEAYQSERYKK